MCTVTQYFASGLICSLYFLSSSAEDGELLSWKSVTAGWTDLSWEWVVWGVLDLLCSRRDEVTSLVLSKPFFLQLLEETEM